MSIDQDMNVIRADTLPDKSLLQVFYLLYQENNNYEIKIE